MKEIIHTKYSKNSLKLLYWSTLIISLMVAIVSVIGILYQERIYPKEALLHAFVPNDYVNLITGLPLLLMSMWLARGGRLMGLLCWPGALFYVLYVYFPYIICVPFSILFIPYLILFTLSIYTLIALIASIDGEAVNKQLSGKVHAKISGSILMGLSVLIIIRQTVLMISALVNKSFVDPQDLALWIDDFALASPAMLIGGFLLFKKRQLGFVAGAGLFLLFGVLSLGLIPFLAIQSHLKNTSTDLMAIVILIIMSAICLIPFSYFVRGANRRNLM
ncbi:MAG: hypothetical protein MUO43_18825, partial [Desulfobacterales bacterium]|nr:hypothetical protein [Desulfobacterales bacterium]